MISPHIVSAAADASDTSYSSIRASTTTIRGILVLHLLLAIFVDYYDDNNDSFVVHYWILIIYWITKSIFVGIIIIIDVSHSPSSSVSINFISDAIRDVLVIRFSVFLLLIYYIIYDDEDENIYFKLDLAR